METAGSVNHAIGQLEGLRHLDELSSSEQAALAARLSRSSDSSAARTFVDELDNTEDVRHFLDEDTAITNQLVDWHAHPEGYRHIDSDATANDFVHVAQNGNVEETQLVVKGTNDLQSRGEVQWLEKGHYRVDTDNGVGMVKIQEKHGGQFETQFGTRNPDDIRDVMYEIIQNPEEISENPGGGTRYYKSFDEANRPVRVSVSNNGFVLSAHPDGNAPI